MDGWMDGWMDVKAVLRVAFTNQKGFQFCSQHVQVHQDPFCKVMLMLVLSIKLMRRVIRNRDLSIVDWQLTNVDYTNRRPELNRASCIGVD